MHSFYSPDIPEPGITFELDERDSKHLFKTLRGRRGESVGLLDGRGTVACAEISENNRLTVVSKTTEPEPSVKLHLLVAAPRRNPMEQMLRQCAEIGVWSITPILTERSVALPSSENTPERWRNILLEGCKQSRNPFIPELSTALTLKDAIDKHCQGQTDAFFGAPSGTPIQPFATSGSLIWMVGPEGGFSSAEEAMLCACGVRPSRIGERIMRVETAAICGAAILINLAEDYEK